MKTALKPSSPPLSQPAPPRRPSWMIPVVLATVGVVALIGFLLLRKSGAKPPAPALSASASSADAAPAALLAAIPAPGTVTASDRGISKWIEKARQNPTDDHAWTNLGDALMQKPRENADYRYYGFAESAYGQALARNPRSVDALNGMAWVTSDRHQFDQSIAWADKALAVDPRSNMAYGLRGDAAVELGHYEEAYKDYQSMLDIRPDASSYSRGAHLLFLTGDAHKAIWLMGKAINAGGPYAENTAWCRAQLALMLFNQGDLLPADQTAQASLKITPDNFQVLAAAAKIKAARRQYPAAIALYTKALAVQPNLDARIALGDLYQVKGDKAEAERQYALVEALHKKNTDISVHDHMQMAQFYADHDRNLVQALQFAEEHKLTENVTEADTLAWCYHKNNMPQQAQAAIQRALAHNTPDARIFFHAGLIYAKAGDRVTAQKYLGQALSLNPNFSPLQAPVAAAALQALGSRPPDAQAATSRF